MARRSPQTQAKRQREQAKREKRRVKDEKKVLRKAQKSGDLTGPEEPVAESESDDANSDLLKPGPLSHLQN
jgi:hypothetical protein